MIYLILGLLYLAIGLMLLYVAARRRLLSKDNFEAPPIVFWWPVVLLAVAFMHLLEWVIKKGRDQ